MKSKSAVTFGEACDMYLNYCRLRNLREGTLRHYRQSFGQFYKYFSEDLPLDEINEESYKNYVLHLKDTLHNDVSINSYLRDLIALFHFLMNEGHIPHFKMSAIKVDKTPVETYTDEELQLLLRKPNLKKCSFIEYECWVITNFLFSTGVRQRSLNNIRVKDLDLENNLVHVNVTKNRKPLIVPINHTLSGILKEFINYRQFNSNEESLFCNSFGKELCKSTGYHMLYDYNKSRGVTTTGIHRYRHTFAKQWILNGGNVVTLSKLLGHSSLEITQNYINLLTSDVAKQVDEISILDKYYSKRINMR
jgi:integrase/recombinase XerD